MAAYDNKAQEWMPPPNAPAPPYSPPGWNTQPGGPQAPIFQQQPQQQWGPPPTGQHYGSGGPIIIQQQPAPQTVVVIGGCPSCRVGHLEDSFTCCGILCCLIFFPLGLICLFTMKDKRCTNCGATF